jgi:hypothetical protein
VICKTMSRRSAGAYKSVVEPPSPARIAQMTAKIRERWTDTTKAARTGYGASHVEIMVVSSPVFDDFNRFREHNA